MANPNISPNQVGQLKNKFSSVHTKKPHERNVTEQAQRAQDLMERIATLVKKHTGSKKELLESLDDLSDFFREQRFESVILPVLRIMASVHKDVWEISKIGDTQMSATPESFENLKKSCQEVQDHYGRVLSPAHRERELQLLQIYGISLEDIGYALRALRQ